MISTAGFSCCCLRLADHTLRGDEGESGRQRSHIPLFSTQSLVLCCCMFTPLPEGITVKQTGLSSTSQPGCWLLLHLFALLSITPSTSLPACPFLSLCHPASSLVQFRIRLFGSVIRQHKSAASLSASLICCVPNERR